MISESAPLVSEINKKERKSSREIKSKMRNRVSNGALNSLQMNYRPLEKRRDVVIETSQKSQAPHPGLEASVTYRSCMSADTSRD